MKNRFVLMVVLLSFSPAAFAQSRGASPAQSDSGAHPSIPPPQGWDNCPRCQNNDDRKQANIKAAVDGHAFDPHDLTGVWGYDGVGGPRGTTFRNPPPMTPWGKQQNDATLSTQDAKPGNPITKDTSGLTAGSRINCDPMGYPRLYTYNYGFEFAVLPNKVVQFFELTHTWRTIWTDGRKLPENPPVPHWMGWNVGRWEGDTFVVESKGYDDRSWLDARSNGGGWTHSDEMNVIERYKRVNYGTLEVELTVIDPKTYTEPWVTPKATIKLVPGTELWEDFCVPSDYDEFNDKVYLPVSSGAKK